MDILLYIPSGIPIGLADSKNGCKSPIHSPHGQKTILPISRSETHTGLILVAIPTFSGSRNPIKAVLTRLIFHRIQKSISYLQKHWPKVGKGHKVRNGFFEFSNSLKL